MRPLFVFCLFIWAWACWGQTTLPTQAVTRQQTLGVWLGQLADRDSKVRQEARVNLMGMTRGELGAFGKLVSESRPLVASQAAVLHEIVIQVYLGGEAYPCTQAGFLGIRMMDTNLALEQKGPVDAAGEGSGVVIIERVPGFCGNRLLQNGDVMLGVLGNPEVRFRRFTDLMQVVMQSKAGQTLQFEVLRQGQIIRVPIKLDARPMAVDDINFQMEQNQRQQKAEEFWEKTFAGLVDEKLM